MMLCYGLAVCTTKVQTQAKISTHGISPSMQQEYTERAQKVVTSIQNVIYQV